MSKRILHKKLKSTPPGCRELKYYGIHACLSIWKKRPNDIIRIYIDDTNVSTFKQVLAWCAKQKKAYHIVPTNELDKISDSVHHEGVCILAKEMPLLKEEEFMSLLPKDKCCLLYLDGVQNPHNIGSILRTCAHFGVAFILGEMGRLPTLSPSACRIAKGGAEIVRLVALAEPIRTLKKLRSLGFCVVATSSHADLSIHNVKLSPKSILAMGAEDRGVNEAILSLATYKVKIPGTDSIESLNVSVAAGLCLGEYYRLHGTFS